MRTGELVDEQCHRPPWVLRPAQLPHVARTLVARHGRGANQDPARSASPDRDATTQRVRCIMRIGVQADLPDDHGIRLGICEGRSRSVIPRVAMSQEPYRAAVLSFLALSRPCRM